MLNKIISDQKRQLIIAQEKIPFAQLERTLSFSERDFYGSLSQGLSYLFECKHISPSEGLLRQDYPVTKLAKQYATHATALSILTNQQFFGGSLLHLKAVSEHTTLPLLCKDIIVHPYQVALARLYHADAILLMLSVLDDKTYLACKKMATRYNMAVVTEVLTEDEMIRANTLNANIVLVNQRNLDTMQIDKQRVFSLAPHFSKDSIIIVGSAIDSHHEINSLKPLVNGFLIGSALSKSADCLQTMRELIYGHVKVCGLTSQDDAVFAYEQGATYGGVIFAPHSLRKITLAQAKLIAQSPIKLVGVFANQPIELIVDYTKALKLTAVQLHGSESITFIQDLRKTLHSSCKIWQAIPGNIPIPTQLPQEVNKFIVDNKTISFGGTGECFDWKMLKHSPLLNKIMLSGGISKDNLIEAKKLKTWGIDVNSKIEQSPGVKDKQMLSTFFKTLKQLGGRNAN